MNKNKHLLLSERIIIEQSLNSEDFITFMKVYPYTPIVQMDSVEGRKGGKVLLTLHFTVPQYMLAFIRNANTSQSVIDIINQLYLELSLMFSVSYSRFFSEITVVSFPILGQLNSMVRETAEQTSFTAIPQLHTRKELQRTIMS